MSATVETHRRIERLAAAMLDMVAGLECDPAMFAQMAECATVQAGYRSVLDSMAVTYAAHAGRGTVVEYERGRPLALMQATLTDVMFGRDRVPLTWCEHRTLFDTRTTMIVAALRYAGCPTCVQARTTAALASLTVDTACDVCGADHGIVTERVVPFGYALASVYTGRCCHDLFTYATPVRTTTYRRTDHTGRNDPCPCGSGRKFKVCHGRAWECGQ